MRMYYIVGGAVLAVLIAIGAWRLLMSGETTPPSEPAGEQEIAGADSDTVREEKAPLPGEALTEPLTAPTFDVVRIDRTGMAVVAGRAEPGTTVRLFANGQEIARAVADPRGEWVMTVETPLDKGDQLLTLRAEFDDGRMIDGNQNVAVTVPDRPDAKPLIVLASPGGTSRVLQGPEQGVGAGVLKVEAIDYDAQGTVSFAGSAEPGAFIRLYLDNKPVGGAQADQDGRWSVTESDPIRPGQYTLRVDLLRADGSVAERVELPFERAAPEDIVLNQGRVVVQPGNSLWRIARYVYGEGVRYTVIYEANADQIRDPDLIYPGQVFDLPE